MIKYKLIGATDIQTFSKLMAEALNDGWNSEGQLVVTPHKYGMQYTQAVIYSVYSSFDKVNAVPKRPEPNLSPRIPRSF